jgi:hypothetical protein
LHITTHTYIYSYILSGKGRNMPKLNRDLIVAFVVLFFYLLLYYYIISLYIYVYIFIFYQILFSSIHLFVYLFVLYVLKQFWFKIIEKKKNKNHLEKKHKCICVKDIKEVKKKIIIIHCNKQ